MEKELLELLEKYIDDVRIRKEHARIELEKLSIALAPDVDKQRDIFISTRDRFLKGKKVKKSLKKLIKSLREDF